MGDNIQNTTTGQITPCLQQRTDKTTYLVEVHFNHKSNQNVEDKLKRVILHDLAQCEPVRMGKRASQEKAMKNDE